MKAREPPSSQTTPGAVSVLAESARVTAAPPARGTFRIRPSATNATHSPSGEKAGACPPAVPVITSASARSAVLIHRCRSPPAVSENTMVRPSGERARSAPIIRRGISRPVRVIRYRMGAGDGDARNQPPTASADAASARPARAIVRGFRSQARPPIRAAVRPMAPAAAVVKRSSVSASANARALSNRSAGTFSSAFPSAAATFGGTALRSSVTGCARSAMIFMIICCALPPVCGGSPASIS